MNRSKVGGLEGWEAVRREGIGRTPRRIVWFVWIPRGRGCLSLSVCCLTDRLSFSLSLSLSVFNVYWYCICIVFYVTHTCPVTGLRPGPPVMDTVS